MSTSIRIGIDVGGTHTKAVAMDNSTHEILGEAVVMTTHDHADGVAAGVIEAFQKCLVENSIKVEDVVFVAHSTTQATNALLEGDVANVGILAMAKGGLEGLLAKKQSKIGDIPLGTGRSIHTTHRFLKEKQATDQALKTAMQELVDEGAQVIVASQAFGVDGGEKEKQVFEVAETANLSITMASDITKLYGLTRRTRTAAINASILPKMLNTANSTEASVRSTGVEVPLMIMRGDGGVMDISEMRKRPVLTMLSGPAASIMGALMYLRASNGIYFEVGGTSTNIGVIKNGRPAVDYTIVGGHRTYINSLDVRVLGIAGGSMLRASKEGIMDVGPRSAHIAGLPYAVYTPEEEIVDPQIEFIQPRPGDPADYVCIRLASGKRVAITNSCAANVLGIVRPEDYSYGIVASARKAMQPLADYVGKTIEEVAEDILYKNYEKIKPVIDEFAMKYSLESDQMTLVGCGGGASSLIPYSAKKMGLKYNIPESAEVISSIGVALSLVRDVVERIIPNPSKEDIMKIKREAIDLAVQSGAVADSVDVHVEIDPQTSKVTAIAMGSSEVRTTDLLKRCSEEEALELAANDIGVPKEQAKIEAKTAFFYAVTADNPGAKSEKAVRIVDMKGFIKVQRSDCMLCLCRAADLQDNIRVQWNSLKSFIGDGLLRPDFYLGIGGKIVDVSNMTDLNQLFSVLESELMMLEDDDEVLLVGAKAKIK